MNTRVAIILSYLFHPLLMPTYLLGVLLYYFPSETGLGLLPLKSSLALLLVIWIYTFAIPVISVYGLVQLKIIRHLSLRTLEERKYPFWLTILIYSAATYFFGWRFAQVSEIAPVLRVVLGSITVSILLVTLISNFWQISAHMTGIGGVTGFILAAVAKVGNPLLVSPLLIAIIASGWIAASRLQLNAHTMSEVFAGYLLGIGICSVGMLLFL